MSFICEICNRPMPIGSKPIQYVTKTREVEYPERVVVDPLSKKRKVIDRGGVGWEIVKQLNICKRCEIKIREE